MGQMKGSLALFVEGKCTHGGYARCTPLHSDKSPLSNKPPKSTQRLGQRMIKGSVYVYFLPMYTHDKDIKTDPEHADVYPCS